MRKLLIAVGSEMITGILEDHLKSDFEICTCSRGDDALQLLEELRPEALIISLALSHVTGLSVLQQSTYKPPAVLALTGFISDAIIEEATSAGAGDLLLFPCTLEYIVYRFKQLL